MSSDTITAAGSGKPIGNKVRQLDLALAARFQHDAIPLMDQLFGGAMRLTGNRHDAEDLLQEAILRAYARFGSFRDGTNLKAWLSKILTNTWIDGYRKKQRRPAEYMLDEITDRRSAAYVANAPIGLRSADVEALESLPDAEVKAALQTLRVELRMAVYYADVEGFSYKEIAEIMNTPVGTVMSRLHRGRRKLRPLLLTLATRRRLLRHVRPVEDEPRG